MFSQKFSNISAVIFVWSTLAVTACCADSISVTDLKGRSITIELTSLANNSVTFRRQGDPKEFTLPVANFDQASQELIRKRAALIPAAMPKIQPEVTLDKRRTDVAGSSYMVKQAITGTIKLTNPSATASVPAATGKIIFLGQNTRTPGLFKILSSQCFEVTLKPGGTFIKEVDPFSTSYDSDNKGSGNSGGYQYFGYFFALIDASDKVILDLTTTGSFRVALVNKPELVKKVVALPKGTMLNDKLETTADTSR